MLRLIKQLFTLLPAQQRKHFFILQFLVILMAFGEIAGVGSIAFFMALIGDTNVIQNNSYLAYAYKITGATSPNEFIFFAGLAALLILAISSGISIFTTWRLAIFGAKVGTEMGDRLFTYYMHQPWLFHAAHNSSFLFKQIASETNRVTTALVQPLLMMNSRIVLIAFISLTIIFLDPITTLFGLAIFSTAYLIIYQLVKLKLIKNGKLISSANSKRYGLMSEGFGGIKDVLLLARQRNFIKRFIYSGKDLAYSDGTNYSIIHIPRYIVELIAFGSMIFFILFLIKAHENNLGTILPILSFYGLTGFKLLPAFQQLYNGISTMKGHIAAFDEIKNDLESSNNKIYHLDESNKHLSLNERIEFRDVSFTYPGKSSPTIKNLSFTIDAKKTIGLVGPSGSGKSTAIDLILGLIHPDEGQLLVDSQILDIKILRDWQNSLGFVPQSIFLTDTSIMENIAFGIARENIDDARIEKSIRLAHLDDFVNQLPLGLETMVGERGVQLSGGQRQRIGIARALYNDADVLILDEATSALDGITEKFIMEAIQDFSGDKTIIMIAHRISTVKECDTIYFMDHGEIIDSGSYNELISRNESFRKMAAQT